MIITNLYGLPQPIVNAVKPNEPTKKGQIRVTSLINPPRIATLTQQHFHEITDDASNRIWLLLGSAIHYILEQGKTSTGLSEERLYMPVEGWTVSGTADYWDDGVLFDFKTTSVASFYGGIKPEWEAQLNCYAALYRYAGFKVHRLVIVPIYRDWHISKAYSHGYPQRPTGTLPVTLWAPDRTMAYIKERVRLHKEYYNCHPKDLPLCTPEERWERPTIYALKKKGASRAINGGLHTDIKEAQAHMTRLGDPKLYIEVRPGMPVRCLNYCNVAPFCDYAQSIKAKEERK